MRKFVLSILAAPLMFAAPSNCPSTTTTAAVSNGSTAPTAPINGAGPSGNAPSLSSDFGTLGATGCQATDLTFSNFTGTFAGTGTGNNALTLGGTYFDATPIPNPNSLTTPTDVLISTVRGMANVSTDGDNNDGTNNWISSSSSPGKNVDDAISFVVTDTGLFIHQITVNINDPAVISTATGSVTFNFCLGEAGTGGPVTSSANCTTASDFFSTSAVALTTTSLQTVTITLPGAYSLFNMTSVVALTGKGVNSAGFDSFDLNFSEEAPEPSSLILLGLGLTGLGVLKLRKRKA